MSGAVGHDFIDSRKDRVASKVTHDWTVMHSGKRIGIVRGVTGHFVETKASESNVSARWGAVACQQYCATIVDVAVDVHGQISQIAYHYQQSIGGLRGSELLNADSLQVIAFCDHVESMKSAAPLRLRDSLLLDAELGQRDGWESEKRD